MREPLGVLGVFFPAFFTFTYVSGVAILLYLAAQMGLLEGRFRLLEWILRKQLLRWWRFFGRWWVFWGRRVFWWWWLFWRRGRDGRMVDARDWLTQAQREDVAEAIEKAEGRTSGEFLCVVATESGRYDRAESIVGLLLAILGMLAAQMVGSHFLSSAPGSWAPGGLVGEGWLILGVVLGFVFGTWLAGRIPRLRRPFIGKRLIAQEVERAASHLFHLHQLAKTEKRVGVMVFISLFERRVVVRADQAAFEVLKEEGLADLRDLALEQLRPEKESRP